MNLIFFSFKDWQIKLICLLLSTGLYFWVLNEDVEERRLNIPLNVLNLPKNLVLASGPPRYIKVNLKGSKRIISTLSALSLKTEIDLLTAQMGSNQTFKVYLKQIDLPERVKVVNFFPKSITLNLEELASKKIKLITQISGKPQKGYVFGKPIIQPEFIFASGPKNKLDNLETLMVDNVNIDNRNSEVRQRVRVRLKNPFFSKTKSALVIVQIFELTGIKKFIIPIQVEGILDLDKRLSYRISHKTVNLKIKLPAKIKLKISDFRAWIDISGTGLDSYGKIVPKAEENQEISIRYPKNIKGLQYLGAIPERIKIFYSIKKEFKDEKKEKLPEKNNEDKKSEIEESN